jgi:uncharacterized protein YaaQ
MEAGFQFTELASTGGLLRQGSVSLLIGVEEGEVDEVLGIIGQFCRPREQIVQVNPPDTRLYAAPLQETMTVRAGGAQVFVLNVEQVVQL